MSFYAATKKSTEIIAHSYAHLYDLPITMFRFFTVYGPWGRPDMALFRFTKAILNGNAIDVYNQGNMYRDFTYIDDLVASIFSLTNVIPTADIKIVEESGIADSKSPVAPFRVVNIGNSKSVKFSTFIETIETEVGMKAKKKFMPMQPGDVPSTWADTRLLKQLVGNVPDTSVQTGVKYFVKWYRDFYKV